MRGKSDTPSRRTVTPSYSVSLPSSRLRTAAAYAAHSETDAGLALSDLTEVSPAPIPNVTRLRETSCTVAMARALTVGCRVTGLVTPRPRAIDRVCAAA